MILKPSEVGWLGLSRVAKTSTWKRFLTPSHTETDESEV